MRINSIQVLKEKIKKLPMPSSQTFMQIHQDALGRINSSRRSQARAAIKIIPINVSAASSS
jgi:hypothetical protein